MCGKSNSENQKGSEIPLLFLIFYSASFIFNHCDWVRRFLPIPNYHAWIFPRFLKGVHPKNRIDSFLVSAQIFTHLPARSSDYFKNSISTAIHFCRTCELTSKTVFPFPVPTIKTSSKSAGYHFKYVKSLHMRVCQIHHVDKIPENTWNRLRIIIVVRKNCQFLPENPAAQSGWMKWNQVIWFPNWVIQPIFPRWMCSYWIKINEVAITRDTSLAFPRNVHQKYSSSKDFLVFPVRLSGLFPRRSFGHREAHQGVHKRTGEEKLDLESYFQAIKAN